MFLSTLVTALTVGGRHSSGRCVLPSMRSMSHNRFQYTMRCSSTKLGFINAISPSWVSMFSSSLRSTKGFKYGTVSVDVSEATPPSASVSPSLAAVRRVICTLKNGTVSFLQAWHVVFKFESSADQPLMISSSYRSTEQLWHCEQVVNCIITSQSGSACCKMNQLYIL